MSYSSTVCNIPDIFKGTRIGNGYEKKSVEKTGRYEIAIGLFHPAMPGHVSLKCGEMWGKQATLGKVSPLTGQAP